MGTPPENIGWPLFFIAGFAAQHTPQAQNQKDGDQRKKNNIKILQFRTLVLGCRRTATATIQPMFVKWYDLI
jgi:hypothetical protein